MHGGGIKYEGSWAVGLFNGQGVMTDKDGNVFEGSWKDGKYYNGKGCFDYRSLKKY